jgi:hypothetical protein
MAYVLMAIPAELVSAVSEFLEKQGRSGAFLPPETRLAPFPPADRHAEEGGFVHGWDEATVRRAYRESADGMRRLLDFLARNPGQEISSYELADAVEARYGWNTIAGMLGAFGRRCVNRYGRSLPMWEFRYDSEGRILLTMPNGPAKAIRGVNSP